MHKIDEKLANVTARLERAAEQAGRPRTEIMLIAVSKTQSAERLRQAYQWGQRRFGENYLQEALDKQQALADLSDIEWHFIGPIQSNKTRAIAEHFSWVHSVDRLKIARRLSDARPPELEPLNVCIQVNIDSEPSKAGVSPEQLPELAAAIAALPQLNLRGLMAIPAPGKNHHDQQASFTQLTNLIQSLRQTGVSSPLDTLSMGMSADLEAAIAAGATMVRIGTDIFGPRAAQSTQV
ncbi:YggS family pyridoxal phosphate-dependent enzyme [Gilvimarinus sp. SDUM040013]|uniref:Pyridoxal phosphate homeostasis protein n=1 Tax=Gilvimarinus gilvus TaxID=3058038 RepID=A0ABU4RZ16_9GAMM|nr:YggS family pyridoxal phosphate-dependent enzyme [Gilvimarinus sp. SDUM040013]MDO3387596.1 YggS family pyridoxal phosphate-dependent enzyme [Gilvimarinus sp. SDUM040013]MDX6850139.1 YggS family pyridoxal phosphate-dependent enzyme [Gilvimarinus sp. SDUM040013]